MKAAAAKITMTAATAYILNGPNLNLLGAREPEIYGRESLAEIEAACRAKADALGLQCDFRQSNNEGELVDWVQEAGAKADGLIINPAGYTHSSVALLDALSALSIPKIELHLSNIHAREPFRRTSVTGAGVDGVVMGFGAAGYVIAATALAQMLGRAP